MRRAWWLGLGALAAVAVGAVVALGGLGGIKGSLAQAAKSPQAAASAPLQFRVDEVVRPVRVRLPQHIEFSGPLVAPQTALVRAKVAGSLVQLNVGEGARVASGQVLGRIDIPELGPRIAERQAQVESAQSALAQAERNHASNERLAAQGFISASALDTTRAAVEAARAQLQAMQASLQTTRVAQRDVQLVAPIAGIVAKRHVLPGEKVSPEQQVLTLVDLRELELAGTVGTHEVAQLTPGMAVQVTVEGLATPLTARLARIAPAAEPGTRSIGATVVLANPQERLRAGQYAVARVTLADETERLVLPQGAVAHSGGQDQVWVLQGGLLQRRAVTLGRRDEAGGRVEVLAGLSPQAQVLAARFDNLREGQPAVLVSAPAPAAITASAPPATAAASR